MPTLNIGGHRVKVGDEFLSLSHEQQSAAVEEISKSLPASDAQAPAMAAPAQPVVPDAAPESKGTLQSIREAVHAPTRALVNGVFMGLGDRARAGIGALIGDGSYGGNLADEQKQSDQFSSAHPIVAPVLEGVGGVATPLGGYWRCVEGHKPGRQVSVWRWRWCRNWRRSRRSCLKGLHQSSTGGA